MESGLWIVGGFWKDLNKVLKGFASWKAFGKDFTQIWANCALILDDGFWKDLGRMLQGFWKEFGRRWKGFVEFGQGFERNSQKNAGYEIFEEFEWNLDYGLWEDLGRI